LVSGLTPGSGAESEAGIKNPVKASASNLLRQFIDVSPELSILGRGQF
jgi:hypothetical protein